MKINSVVVRPKDGHVFILNLFSYFKSQSHQCWDFTKMFWNAFLTSLFRTIQYLPTLMTSYKSFQYFVYFISFTLSGMWSLTNCLLRLKKWGIFRHLPYYLRTKPCSKLMKSGDDRLGTQITQPKTRLFWSFFSMIVWSLSAEAWLSKSIKLFEELLYSSSAPKQTIIKRCTLSSSLYPESSLAHADVFKSKSEVEKYSLEVLVSLNLIMVLGLGKVKRYG